MKLVFTAGEGWTGVITRWWTFSDVGHVAAELEPGLYLDATPKRGVAKHCDLAGRIVGTYAVMVGHAVLDDAVEWAIGECGKAYDWSAIFGLAARRDWHDPSHWQCAELWAAAFEMAGSPLLRADHLDRITPRDLLMSPLLRPA